MTRSRVLVTGGAGFIGSHTVDRLVARGHKVRVIDNLSPRIHPRGKPTYMNTQAEFLEGDVTCREDLLAALSDVQYVIHLAAYQDYQPDFSTFAHTNVGSTALLYELIVEKHLPVNKVIVASSQAVYGEGRYFCVKDGVVYPRLRENARLARGDWSIACPRCGGGAQWQPTDESTPQPQNAYALSKYSQEQFALTLGRRYGIPSVAMRYSIVQGPRQSFFNAYSGACRIFCLSVYFDQPLVVYEDGQQVRDYVNIDDVVNANMLVLEDHRANYEAFNVGGGRGYTVMEFAAIVARSYGKGTTPQLPGFYRFGDTRHIVSDISKIQTLGWVPMRTPEESVHEYIAWLSQQSQVEDILAYTQQQMKKLEVLRQANDMHR